MRSRRGGFVSLSKNNFFCVIYYNFFFFRTKGGLKVTNMLSKISSMNNILVSFYFINSSYNIVVNVGILKFLSKDLYVGRFLFSPVQYILVSNKNKFFFAPIPSFADKLVIQAIGQQLRLVIEFFKGLGNFYYNTSNYYLKKNNNFTRAWRGLKSEFKFYKWVINGLCVRWCGGVEGGVKRIFKLFYLKVYIFIDDIIFKFLLEKYFRIGYLFMIKYNILP